ncbi:MAG: glutamine--fructose-6-phosphate transaminase (isomerizing) [Candidatus Nanopelagicales bacterium]
MCGIVGYVGEKSATKVVIDGLRRLEYRGYDSAGIATIEDGQISFRKRAGKLSILESELDENPLAPTHTAIGHTRWATHGGPNDSNAHPHISADGKVAVIHNGIIENFTELKTQLLKSGVDFQSETDTEVVAHLLSEAMRVKDADLADALRGVCKKLRGAFTLVVVHADQPELVVGARRNSPLVVGIGDKENFLASDVAAFIEHTRTAIELGQDQVVELRSDSVRVTDFDGNPAITNQYEVTWDIKAAEKSGFDTFMLKEINEQPKAVADTLLGRIQDNQIVLDDLKFDVNVLKNIDKIIITACGTAYHAGLIAKYAIERWTRIPCEVELASEFRYRDPVLNEKILIIAISQSGETMDTLMATRYAREQGSKVLAICNTQGSTIPRESDAVVYTHAGPEIAVASTKAFITQVIAVYVFALFLAQVRGSAVDLKNLVSEVSDMSAKVDLVLDTIEPVRALAEEFKDATSVLFIGRHVGFPVALEGALKLKELAYMHAEGFAAGELKHGPIALLESGVPVIVIVPPVKDSVLHEKIVSNIQEVRARGAKTIIIAEENDSIVEQFADYLIRIPQCPTLLQPVVSVVPLQVFAAEMATLKGYDVDQPRNLAKSVTVE